MDARLLPGTMWDMVCEHDVLGRLFVGMSGGALYCDEETEVPLPGTMCDMVCEHDTLAAGVVEFV